MRVVLDTNALVSALLFKGRLARLVELWRSGAITPLISRDTFAELSTVLAYPKFSLNAEEVRAIIEDEILPYFEVVDVTERVVGACRDPYDDMFLSVAASAKADFIVSGDDDLLKIGGYGAVLVISVREFLERCSV